MNLDLESCDPGTYRGVMTTTSHVSLTDAGFHLTQGRMVCVADYEGFREVTTNKGVFRRLNGKWYKININQDENDTMNKDDAKNKLAELTLKVNELQAIIDKPDITPWEPKGGSYLICINNEIGFEESTQAFKNFGLERATEEIAKGAYTEINRYNRLLAYRDENDTPNYRGDGYIIVSDDFFSSYGMSAVTNPSLTDVVFQYKHNAQLLCEKLKSGEVVL